MRLYRFKLFENTTVTLGNIAQYNQAGQERDTIQLKLNLHRYRPVSVCRYFAKHSFQATLKKTVRRSYIATVFCTGQ